MRITPRIAIAGAGVVSPAGWSTTALTDALTRGEPLPTSPQERPGSSTPPAVRAVPDPPEKLPFLRQARLRRTSPITRFLIAACREALGEKRTTAISDGSLRVGVICTVMNACVNYSNRFYSEVLADPSVASPILFPETVYNAPSSHVSAFFGSTEPNDTLVGDTAQFIAGLDLAVQWLTDNRDLDGCLVACAEELDWLSTEGLRIFRKDGTASEGAAALYLERSSTPEIEIAQITTAHTITNRSPRPQAASAMRRELPTKPGEAVLLSGLTGNQRVDRDESSAWADWSGEHQYVIPVLGDAMGARVGLQCAAAVGLLRLGLYKNTLISAIGENQQACGAHFQRL